MSNITRLDNLCLAGDPGAGTNLNDPNLVQVEAPVTIVASTSEQDTGVALPANGIVVSALIRVNTAEVTGGTPTVDVGIVGDPDAMIDAGSVSAAGAVGQTGGAGETASVSTAGANIAYALGSADFAELDATIIVLVQTYS